MYVYLFSDGEKIIHSLVAGDLKTAQADLLKFLAEQVEVCKKRLEKSNEELDTRKNGYDEYIKNSDKFLSEEKDEKLIKTAKESQKESKEMYEKYIQEVNKYQENMKKNIDTFSISADKFLFSRMELSSGETKE